MEREREREREVRKRTSHLLVVICDRSINVHLRSTVLAIPFIDLQNRDVTNIIFDQSGESLNVKERKLEGKLSESDSA